MKLVIVVQRYGADINGGAELHARYVAERLAAHADVRVLTTCARDYVTWRNEWRAGRGARQRHSRRAIRRRSRTRHRRFSRQVLASLRRTPLDTRRTRLAREPGANQPDADEAAVERRAMTATSCCCSASGTARRIYGARFAAQKAVSGPDGRTRIGAGGLSIFPPVFRGVRAIMYNSLRRACAHHDGVSSNTHVPGVVVGVGSQIPDAVDPERARQKFGLHNPFIIYVGRIDANKGCAELFRNFIEYTDRLSRPLDLVLDRNAGTPHPRSSPYPASRIRRGSG